MKNKTAVWRTLILFFKSITKGQKHASKDPYCKPLHKRVTPVTYIRDRNHPSVQIGESQVLNAIQGTQIGELLNVFKSHNKKLYIFYLVFL